MDKSKRNGLRWLRLALCGYLLVIFVSGTLWAWHSDLVLTPDSGEYATHIQGLTRLCQEGRWQEVARYYGGGTDGVDLGVPFPFLTLFLALPFVFSVAHLTLALYLYQATVTGLLIWGTERCATRLYNGRIGVIAATILASLLFLTVNVHNCYADALAGCLLVWSYYAYLRSEACTSRGWTALMACCVSAGCLTKWAFFPVYAAPFYLFLLVSLGWQGWKRSANLARRSLVLIGCPLVCLAVMAILSALAIKWDFHFLKSIVIVALLVPVLAKLLHGKGGWEQGWIWHTCFFVPVLVYYWDSSNLVIGNFRTNLPLNAGASHELVDAEYVFEVWWVGVWSMGLEAVRIIREGLTPPIPFGVMLISLLVALFGRRYRAGQVCLWLYVVVPGLLYLALFRNIAIRYLLVMLPFAMIALGAVWSHVHRGLRWLLLSLLIGAKLIYCCGWLSPLSLPKGDEGCLNLDWMTINRDQRYHISVDVAKWKTPDYSPFYSWHYFGAYGSEIPWVVLAPLRNDWEPPIRRLLDKVRHLENGYPLVIGITEGYVPVTTASLFYKHQYRLNWNVVHVDSAEAMIDNSTYGEWTARYYIGVVQANDENMAADRAINRLLWSMAGTCSWAWVPLGAEKLDYEFQLGTTGNYYVVLVRYMPYLDSRAELFLPVVKTKQRLVY